MGRLLPCPKCCPRRPEYNFTPRVRHELDLIESGKWAWVCDNCGNVKKPRTPRKTVSYDYVTKEAPTDDGMSRVNSIRFHCFNPNGLYARLRAMQERVVEVVDRTGCPNGVFLVHGSLHDFPRNQLFKLLDQKRPDRIAYTVTLNGVERSIREGHEWCDAKLAEHGLA